MVDADKLAMQEVCNGISVLATDALLQVFAVVVTSRTVTAC